MKSENFKITGISYYHDNIMNNLAYESYDYNRPNSELKEFYSLDERIYRYDFDDTNPALVPEPDNPHDPNAIRVEVNGIQIGYIKKGSCSHVRNLLNSPDFDHIEIKIGGGEYKCFWEDEDEKIQMEHGTKELWARLTIFSRGEPEPPKPVENRPINPRPAPRPVNPLFSVLFVVLLIAGLCLFSLGITAVKTATVKGIFEALVGIIAFAIGIIGLLGKFRR